MRGEFGAYGGHFGGGYIGLELAEELRKPFGNFRDWPAPFEASIDTLLGISTSHCAFILGSFSHILGLKKNCCCGVLSGVLISSFSSTAVPSRFFNQGISLRAAIAPTNDSAKHVDITRIHISAVLSFLRASTSMRG